MITCLEYAEERHNLAHRLVEHNRHRLQLFKTERQQSMCDLIGLSVKFLVAKTIAFRDDCAGLRPSARLRLEHAMDAGVLPLKIDCVPFFQQLSAFGITEQW